jgi:hypothetical protein
MKTLRHGVAIAVLPFTVTVLVPLWIARRSDVAARLGSTGVDCRHVPRIVPRLRPWTPIGRRRRRNGQSPESSNGGSPPERPARRVCVM